MISFNNLLLFLLLLLLTVFTFFITRRGRRAVGSVEFVEETWLVFFFLLVLLVKLLEKLRMSESFASVDAIAIRNQTLRTYQQPMLEVDILITLASLVEEPKEDEGEVPAEPAEESETDRIMDQLGGFR